MKPTTKKKKKKITHKYILQEMEIAEIILDEIDKANGGNPEVRKKLKFQHPEEMNGLKGRPFDAILALYPDERTASALV